MSDSKIDVETMKSMARRAAHMEVGECRGGEQMSTPGHNTRCSRLSGTFLTFYLAGLERAQEIARPFETKRWNAERGLDESAADAIDVERRKVGT